MSKNTVTEMFLSPYTSAVLESKSKEMHLRVADVESESMGRGGILMRVITGFPDGIVIYSDGTVSHIPMLRGE